MALFDALSELVGAAVLTAAPLCDLAVSEDAMRRRGELARALQERGEAGPIVEIIDALAREIWVGAETRGLSQHALEHHASAVAAILAEHGPTRLQLAQAIERARTGTGQAGTGQAGTGQAGTGHAGGEPIARRIAVDVFAKARGQGAVAAADLKDDVTLFLVDRVYAHLLDAPRTLFAMAPALSDFIAGIGPKAAGAALERPAGDAAPAMAEPASAVDAIAALGVSAALGERIQAAGGPALLADIRERYGIGDKALRRLLALVDSRRHRPESMIGELESLARWVGDVRAQLTKPSNEEADVRRLKQKAAGALADGDFEAAIEALRQVRQELREGRRRIEERLAEEVTALKSQMLEEARATARLAELALAGGSYREAADLFAEAALTLPTSDRDGIWRFQLLHADALYRQAEGEIDAKLRGEVLAAYNRALRMVSDGSDQKGLGLANLGLANTLLLIGEQEAGVGRLQDGAAAYRKAINCLERAQDKGAWSLAQLRLGRTLALIGERQQAAGTLREAAQAFREALKEIGPEKAPTDHATAMMGLGGVLLSLEEREGGLPLLTEAAEAYRAALGVLDKSARGADVAECQLSLGLALLGLGEQQRAKDKLEAAITAFRAAIEGYPRATAAPKWALAQMNLGNALAALGDASGDNGVPLLEQAIAAYNAALEVFKRESEALKWAITQMNLGTALIRLGERREKRRNWLAAAGALVPALEVFEAQRADAYADVTRRNLRRFHESWETLIAAPEDRGAQPRPRMSKAG